VFCPLGNTYHHTARGSRYSFLSHTSRRADIPTCSYTHASDAAATICACLPAHADARRTIVSTRYTRNVVQDLPLRIYACRQRAVLAYTAAHPHLCPPYAVPHCNDNPHPAPPSCLSGFAGPAAPRYRHSAHTAFFGCCALPPPACLPRPHTRLPPAYLP